MESTENLPTEKTVYSFDPDSGEYLGTDVSQLSPANAEEGYLLVPNTTDEAPPAVADEQVAVFRNGTWHAEEDYRGTVYWGADRKPYVCDFIGPLPAGASLTKPAPTQAEQLAIYEVELDKFLDAKAQGLTFKDRTSLALRAAYPNKWQALGLAFGEWMDNCNDLAWKGRQDILDGKRPMPATAEEFLAELPEFVSP